MLSIVCYYFLILVLGKFGILIFFCILEISWLLYFYKFKLLVRFFFELGFGVFIGEEFRYSRINMVFFYYIENR